MKRKIIWLLVSCLMVAALLLASCGPAVTEEEEVVTGEEEEEVTEIETPTYESPLSAGETARFSLLAVTISDIITTDSYEYYSKAEEKTLTKEAKPGFFLVIFTLEIENVGTGQMREGFQRTRMTDARGYFYSPGYHLGLDRIEGYFYLSPGDKMEGKVLFIIPEGATDLKVGYYPMELTPDPLAEWEVK